MAKQKIIVPTLKDLSGKIKVLNKKRKNMRRKFTETEEYLGHKTKKIAAIAKRRKVIRGELTTTEKNIYKKTEKMAVVAKEKESAGKKLLVKARMLRTNAKKLAKKAKRAVNDKNQLKITAGQLAEAKVKEDALLANIGDGVIAIDNAGTIILMNKKAEVILGYENGELLGKKVYDVLPIEDKQGNKLTPEKRPIHTSLVEGKNVANDEYFYERKDGVRVPVAINGAPIILNKKIIGSVNVFRDITKEKELDKAKDEFISLASHQLKTPITAISWNIEALLNGDYGPLTEKQKEIVERISKSGKNMAELVTGFLDITKMESSGFAVERGDADLLQISDSVLAELVGQISTKKINIVRKYGIDIPHLNIGIKSARVIFQNLISNAVKYTPEGGTVEVRIEKNAEGISISIKDNGYGIPEESKTRIFTKLFRADNILEKEPSGTGLGLYLLKNLVDKLGGKVWFESKEGSGTTFYVNLK